MAALQIQLLNDKPSVKIFLNRHRLDLDLPGQNHGGEGAPPPPLQVIRIAELEFSNFSWGAEDLCRDASMDG